MKKRLTRGGQRLSVVWLIIILLAGYGGWALRRPLPALQPLVASLPGQTTAAKLVWPASGQSAVGVVGTSILETHGAQSLAPTASTAKIITALVVLQAKPLQSGQPGPTITLSASDVAVYNAYNAQGGSVVRVVAGEQISEYQMLQAMLLPSANNMADSLASWAFGSLSAYQTAATSFLAAHGLGDTKVGNDASGLAPTTVSNAHDLVKLGELVMQDPVLASVVGQVTAAGIPMASTVKNVNFLLGTAGIIGIKTGNTDQAGGVFVSASRVSVNNKPVTIVTALVGAPSLWQAMTGSLPLIQSAQTNFQPVTVVKAGTVVGHYRQPWDNKQLAAVASQDLPLTTWRGKPVPATAHLQTVTASATASQTVGSVTTAKTSLSDQKSVTVRLQTTPTKPTIWWRLSHPVK